VALSLAVTRDSGSTLSAVEDGVTISHFCDSVEIGVACISMGGRTTEGRPGVGPEGEVMTMSSTSPCSEDSEVT